jgi:hypothetical protein
MLKQRKNFICLKLVVSTLSRYVCTLGRVAPGCTRLNSGVGRMHRVAPPNTNDENNYTYMQTNLLVLLEI